MTRLVAAVLLTLLLTSTGAAASDLRGYSERVTEAAQHLQDALAEDAFSEECVTTLKSLLPKSEEVEFDGRTVATDNTWLYVLLDSADAEKDAEKRQKIVTEAANRLSALEYHLEAAANESSGDSAADAREKIKEILARSEYLEKKDNPLTAFIKETRQKVIAFLRDLYLRIVDTLFGQGSGGSWFFRILIIALLAIAVIFAARALTGVRRGKKREKKRTVLGEEIAANITSADLANEAIAAARAGDFRTAVRRLYISLLYELAERNLLELEAQATNREYLARVSRYAPLAAPMRYLTDRFDYVWYGMFPSTEEDFAAFQSRYREAMEQARNLGQSSSAA
ncbi:MAG TPA: DUF4129 domain-containing protein [Blastocatellia bacterium]|nr:DUF4129 domain-containing protein [Blastocatellia bacterium]